MSDKALEGWKTLKLSQIAKISSGGTPSRKVIDYWNGDIYWVTTGEMNSRLILDTQEKITGLGLRNSSVKIFPAGTILIALYGQGKTRGMTARLGISAATNQACAAILLEPGFLEEFYFHYFVYQYAELRKASNSGTQKNLSAEILKSFSVPVLPVSEQQKIARILSTWDAAIDCVQKLLENSRQQKKALMQQLLTGKRRLPGFGAKWQHTSLKNLLHPRSESGYAHLPLVSITSTQGVIYRSGLDKKDTSSEDKSQYLRICPGDIGYNTMRMWQGVSGLSYIEGIVSPAYTVCIPTNKADGRFFAYLFKFTPIIHLFYRYSQGLVSDTWNLKYPVFSTVKVLVPSREEQTAIANVLSACDAVIAQYEAKLANLRAQKKALMQQLLTGKRRVKIHDTEVC